MLKRVLLNIATHCRLTLVFEKAYSYSKILIESLIRFAFRSLQYRKGGGPKILHLRLKIIYLWSFVVHLCPNFL